MPDWDMNGDTTVDGYKAEIDRLRNERDWARGRVAELEQRVNEDSAFRDKLCAALKECADDFEEMVNRKIKSEGGHPYGEIGSVRRARRLLEN